MLKNYILISAEFSRADKAGLTEKDMDRLFEAAVTLMEELGKPSDECDLAYCAALIKKSGKIGLATRNEQDRQPLHLLADSGYTDLSVLALELGADPRQPDGNNDTPDRLAEKAGHQDTADRIKEFLAFRRLPSTPLGRMPLVQS